MQLSLICMVNSTMLDVSKVLALGKGPDKGESIQSIRLCDISRDESQPRTVFDDQSLLDLAEDIEANGLLQPILVREESVGKYKIIAGERRYRAFSLLNKPEIPCIIRDVVSTDTISDIGYLQMSENLKRDNLKFFEIAEFIQSRVDSKEQKVDIAKKLGISSKDITCYLSWGKAPDWLKSYKNKFTSAHTFYAYVQFANKQDENALKEFMSTCDDDVFSRSMLNGLKAKDAAEEVSAESKDFAGAMKDSQQDASSTEGFDDQSAESDAFNDDSNETFESAAVASEEESPEDDDVQFYSADEDHAADDSLDDGDINASGDADNEVDEYALSDSFAEEKIESSDAHDDIYKKPIILGYVDGREAELLYKTKPQSDGFVWVKYEDGSQAEALAEQFTLNRIIEG